MEYDGRGIVLECVDDDPVDFHRPHNDARGIHFGKIENDDPGTASDNIKNNNAIKGDWISS